MSEKIAAVNSDDIAIDAFTAAMKAKMRRSREEKGRGGWQTASAAHLTYLLVEHLAKGDPVDVANFAMMLHQNGQNIDEAVVQAYRKAVAGSEAHEEEIIMRTMMFSSLATGMAKAG
ncbi:MAG: hypothetical protein M1492_08325 [Gammaproteobacteria bacterium]|jgi:hypothetical protein|nr:hypothetical protein [Gammaproteobacteria bacterium]